MSLSQNKLILNHLRLYKSIDPQTALEKYSCMRLASRISDLKAQGYVITKTMAEGLNKHGDRVRFARYSLIE